MENEMKRTIIITQRKERDISLPGVQKKILRLLESVERPGMPDLIKALKNSDYFTAPASIKHHLAIPGGLALHSFNVYRLLTQRMKHYYGEPGEWPVPRNSIIICSLLHDACKINYYISGAHTPLTPAMKYKLAKEWKQSGHEATEENQKKFIAYVFDEENQVRDIPKNVGSLLIDWLLNNPEGEMPDLPYAWKIQDNCPIGHGEKSVSFIQNYISLTILEKMAIRWHMGPWDISTYGKPAYDIAEKESFVALLYLCDYEASHILDWMMF